MNQREIEKAIENEVAQWPDVAVEFVPGSKHPKAKLKFGELLLSVSYASTPSDSFRGLHNCLSDVRKALRKMGAERSKPEPSKEEDEAPYRKPNDGAEKRPSPVAGEKAEPKPTVAEQLVEAGVAVTDPTVTTSGTAKFAAVGGEVYDLETGEALDDEEDETEAKRAAVRAAAEGIVDGVYFGLPEEVYHAVPRLSASGLQNLAISPATFWAKSWLNPDKAETELDEEATRAQVLGKAYHCARLEPEAFDARYCRKPSKDDFPAKGLLTSDAAIKAALKERGEQQTITGETIADRGRRLLDCGYRGTVLAVVMDDYEAQRAGRIGIEGRFYDQIVTDMERIKATGPIAQRLTGGVAEVSIFWTDKHGLKMKARLDYLKVEEWTDLKTFDNARGKVLSQAIADFIRYNRTYIQAATYREATEAVRIGGLDVVGDATEAQRRLVYDLRTRAKPLACWFVFTEKGGVPNLLSRQFRFHAAGARIDAEVDALVEEDRKGEVREALGSPTGLYSRALWEIDRAKRDFVLYSEVYAPGDPWFPIDVEEDLSDLDFNSYWLEGKA